MKTIMTRVKSCKKYISEPDRFLADFDQMQPQQSKSQQKEIEEYQNLFYHRDIKTIASESP
ncbi:MAG: CBU_0585 family protein [Pseudomonadota bacterium]